MKHRLKFILIGFLIAGCAAFAPAENQDKALGRLPIPKLPTGLVWQTKLLVPEPCMYMSPFYTKDPMAVGGPLTSIVLPGEFHVAVSSADLEHSHVFADFEQTLISFGYTRQIPLPDKGILVSGIIADGPDGGTAGWLKQDGNFLRAIVLDHHHAETEVNDQTYTVFISTVISLKRLLAGEYKKK